MSPAPGIDPTTFSVRWSGMVEGQYSEKYDFCVRVDDGVRLWVGEELLVDEWHYGNAEYCNRTLLAAGIRVPIVMEYFQQNLGAIVQLRWSSEHTKKQIIPQSQLYDPCPIDDDSAPTGTLVEDPIQCPHTDPVR